eukprot:21896-Prorocentrum_minimum.AAC.1
MASSLPAWSFSVMCTLMCEAGAASEEGRGGRAARMDRGVPSQSIMSTLMGVGAAEAGLRDATGETSGRTPPANRPAGGGSCDRF